MFSMLGVKCLLILSFLVITGECCMPGYEAERAKLRQYLGIEWVPHGLDAFNAKKPKIVRHSDDLNCDFSDPAQCNWQNVKNLDNLDFYLFEKEDHTEFPLVQVRPGPSKVPAGDKLLFVGDKKRQEMSAILSSYPIKCQNTTGRLTFTFWVYNGARVEVLILEEDPKDHKKLNIAPEKPYIDCGTVTMNTECTVEIPPRLTPFRIAIRAYDIMHPEGSFVLLDNIFYEAEFCHVSIDFGPSFETQPLVTSAEGMPIGYSKDLTCSEFDKTCRWRNGGHGKMIWKRATRAPPDGVMFNETGTYTAPKGAYAFMYIEEGTAKEEGFKSLMSDPISCQAGTGAILSFRMWTTKGVKMSICAIDYDMNELECQKIPMGRSPAPTVHHFDRTKEFMYAFKIDEVNTDYDNFVMIDDIEYDSTMCHEAINALDVGKNFYSTRLLGTILDRPVHSIADLACNFEKRGIDCFWANLDEVEKINMGGKWEVGLGPIDEMKFSSLTRRKTFPEGEFAIARFPAQQAKNGSALLLSETIKCLIDPTVLTFRFWSSGGAALSVCVLRSFSSEIIDCQELGPGTAETVLVEIPHYDEPIRLALKAEPLFGEGFVAIDDIELEGQVCSSNAAFSGNSGSKSKSGTKNMPLPDANVCRLLSCDFDHNHLCLYESHRVASSVAMFRAYNGSVKTMLFSRSPVSMFESPTFQLNAPARLHFDFAIKGGPIQLFFCTDSLRGELDSCYKVVTKKTTASASREHDYVEVLPSDTKLYVITKLEKGIRKASVEMDNFLMTDSDNHRIC